MNMEAALSIHLRETDFTSRNLSSVFAVSKFSNIFILKQVKLDQPSHNLSGVAVWVARPSLIRKPPDAALVSPMRHKCKVQ